MKNDTPKPMDLEAAQANLAGKRGADYWRSLDELSGTEDFRNWLDDEFPNRASLLSLDRRDFIKVMGASLALAGLTGCRFMPQEKIVAYVKAPEEIVPGKPVGYATAYSQAGIGMGVVVTSNMGRPTKVEGNEKHPSSLGATDIFAQASLLTLYDPDRQRTLTHNGELTTWDAFLAWLRPLISRPETIARVRFLSEASSSPTLAAQIERLKKALHGPKWYVHEPAGRDAVYAGTQTAFGAPLNPVYHFDKASVVLSLDSDFLTAMVGSVRYARDFASGRQVRKGADKMNRLYAVECCPNNTGATADHRISAAPSELEAFAVEIARALGVDVGAAPLRLDNPALAKFAQVVAKDLKEAGAAAVVVSGEQTPPAIQALGHAMNSVLGSVGTCVGYTQQVEIQGESLDMLLQEIDEDKVEVLFILNTNPAYSAPVDLNFASRVKKVANLVYLGLYPDETAALCQWHIPATHYLESWSDTRGHDGTHCIVQPLIEPLYSGKSVHDLLSAIVDEPVDGYELVHGQLLGANPTEAREKDWQTWLHDGIIPNSAFAESPVTLNVAAVSGAASALVPAAAGFEIALRPDPTIFDGRFANNGWLQELPKPLTKLVWDNAILISPKMAREMKLSRNDMVKLSVGSQSVKAPVWVLPGHPTNSVTLHLGYGRRKGGVNLASAGTDAYALQQSATPWNLLGAKLEKLSGTYDLVTAQDHHAIDVGEIGNQQNRPLIQGNTFEEFVKDNALPHNMYGPSEVHHGASEGEGHTGPPSLYDAKEHANDGNAWGMSIDLTLCTGCNACVTACQAENNIPVVGREQVRKGREMHWIRIDRYYRGNPEEEVEALHQPILCMHCENAPCEPVCPVGATVHSHEGLNQMVYNRCVGTRYCSNNCPYKVRRFNFLNYANHHEVPVLKLLNNPNVTVRGRGVMEKCTYCVQRINAARIEAKKADTTIKDGGVITACQQVCPPKAIVFGNIHDTGSKVRELKDQPHDYSLLEEVNTRPRTTYLKKVVNQHPDLQHGAHS